MFGKIKFNIPVGLNDALTPKPCRVFRASEIVISKKIGGKPDRKQLAKRTIAKRTDVKLKHEIRQSCTSIDRRKQMTVMEMLMKNNREMSDQRHREQHYEIAHKLCDETAYIKQV